LFTTIVTYMFALEFDQLHESGMLAVHRSWNWSHTLGSESSRISS
jgi:hypothetical protein